LVADEEAERKEALLKSSVRHRIVTPGRRGGDGPAPPKRRPTPRGI